MTPDTTALRARLRDDCALCGHNHQPYVEVPREDFIALCDAADAAERLRANGNGYLQRAHAAEAVIERMRCAHCGEVGCDWIGDIRKARAEMAEAALDGTSALAGEALERALVAEARLVAERDLAVAHDRQPYPTAWAYEQACKALRKAEAQVASVLALADGWTLPTRKPFEPLPDPRESALSVAAVRIRAAVDGA